MLMKKGLKIKKFSISRLVSGQERSLLAPFLELFFFFGVVIILLIRPNGPAVYSQGNSLCWRGIYAISVVLSCKAKQSVESLTNGQDFLSDKTQCHALSSPTLTYPYPHPRRFAR
jgi:hypothetical protein